VSFILDALRKSEHQRQKSTGPGLAEIPVAAPRPKTNVWATAAVTLLVVNLTAVGILLLRRADSPPAPEAAAPAAPATTAAPITTQAPAAAGNPTLAAPTPAPVTVPVAPASAAQRPVETGRNPLAEELGESAQGLDPGMADAAASVPAGPPAVVRQEPPRRGGSVVYAPVPEAGDAPYSPPPAEAEPGPGGAPATVAPGGTGLPGADEMVARGVPELHLDLHVYSTVPKQRFIFVNSRKYGEGATLQEGPVVEAITPDGAVLSFRGSRFKLSH
jgi:general secretion pathway protein B